jgi:hypothetical protein
MTKKGKTKASVPMVEVKGKQDTIKSTAFVSPGLIEGSVKMDSQAEVIANNWGSMGGADSYDDDALDYGGNGASVRRNRAATITRSERYSNIEGGVVPFIYSASRGKYTSNISIRDAIILCQKCYYNFSVFRNTIDLMTEFSCSPIYFTGGNAQSRKFFEAWSNRVNLWRLQDEFYREYYRSGNVFLYKLNAIFNKEDLSAISDVLTAAKQKEVPIRYIILNPADIQSIGSASFISPRYVKVLNDFEMQVLTNPKSDEEKDLAKRIQEFGQLQETVKTAQSQTYLVFYLDPDRVKAVFYKKQPYEPFGVPMGFPVLQDINWKQELKNIDMAISRTIQQSILLVTMGNDEVGMPTAKQIANLKNIFQNESVGRILVTDYTTNAKFVIPEVDKLLDPKKYQIVNEDIKNGLNNVLIGDEKYANSSTKVEMFLARLKHAREVFLNEFLLPEIKFVGEQLGFKSIPTPRFKDSDFKDDPNLARIYSRLIEIGVLTPEEGITALETGRLPLPEESVESQKKLHDYHEDGLYQPLLNNPNLVVPQTGKIELGQQPKAAPQKSGPASSGLSGRPPGTGTPKSVNNVGKIGKKVSAKEVASNLARFDLLEGSIENYLKEKFKRKKLIKEQKQIVSEIAETIAINEKPQNWLESIAKYVNEPVQANENLNEVTEISEKHGVDTKTAILLMHSQIEEQ